jgi:hypothetical protein
MVQMPAGPKNEVWNLVLVRVPKGNLAACTRELAELAVPAQYAGHGWYIKRIEAIQSSTAKDPYSLSIAVKAGSEAAMRAALDAIGAILQKHGAQFDVYVVSGIEYMANW